jgi:hypothetical protein
MRQDDFGEQAGMAGDEVVTDRSGADRRRAFRRKLPFGRGAILSVGERAHIVGLADVSITGAYLTARAPVSAGETHGLKVPCPRAWDRAQVEVVRVSPPTRSPQPPRGVAVRFLDVDNTSRDLPARDHDAAPRAGEGSRAPAAAGWQSH